MRTVTFRGELWISLQSLSTLLLQVQNQMESSDRFREAQVVANIRTSLLKLPEEIAAVDEELATAATEVPSGTFEAKKET